MIQAIIRFFKDVKREYHQKRLSRILKQIIEDHQKANERQLKWLYSNGFIKEAENFKNKCGLK